MANDNQRRPLMAMIQSRHAEKPPEHGKHGGSILVLHPVIPVHIPPGLAGMTSAKNPDITRYAVRKCFLQLAGS